MFSMKTRTSAGLLAAAAALSSIGSIGVAGAQASAPAKTKLSIHTQNGDFQGAVKSSKRKCMNNREVHVFRQLGSQRHPSTDEEVASDTSSIQNGVGHWETGNTGLRDGKRYYAYTPSSSGCKSAMSGTVTTVLD